MRRTTTVLAVCAGMALAGCNRENSQAIDNASAAAGTSKSATDLLRGTDGLGTTARLVRQAGLDRTLDGVGSYTLFAPADTAFASLPDATRKDLDSEAGRPQLLALLRRHLVTGYIAQADIDRGLAADGGTVRVAALAGAPLVLRKQGDAVVVGEGTDAPRIVGAPLVARNAVIYRIDRVLPPPTGK